MTARRAAQPQPVDLPPEIERIVVALARVLEEREYRAAQSQPPTRQ